MAFKRLPIDGYGQLELNNAAFRRDGRIEAQCALSSDFSAKVPAENGMILAVDKGHKTVGFIKDENLPIAINYTTEHMYDERANALKDFKLEPGTFYPRMGYPAVGDLYTTNCIGYDSGEFADEDGTLLKKALDKLPNTPLYAEHGEKGVWKITATPPTGFGAVVTKKTTMPDGQLAVQLQILAV